MKVFLENFSKEDELKITETIADVELVDNVEDSDFWFTPVDSIEDILHILVKGVEVEDDEKEISKEDLEQRKA